MTAWRGIVNNTLAAVALIALAMMAGFAVPAQAYPDRVVRIVVPAAAGGALDTIARLLAQKVSQGWPAQVIVENKPGANFMIGMDAVAKASPDGYTLLFVSSAGLTINPYVFPNMTLAPLADLKPVMLVTSNPFALVVNDRVPAGSVGDFIGYVRAHPGKLNHGSNSASTMLVSELFKSQAKLDYLDVNYRGASQAILAALEDTVQFCFVDFGTALTSVKGGGRLRLLAFTGAKADPHHPEIPTLVAHGVSATSFTVLMVPPGTPTDVVDTIDAAFQRALDDPDISARLVSIGQQIIGGSPEHAMQELRAEAAQWERLVKERHIRFGQ
jgi:tripartite-type tricarboxylate transporter receptor subunit TctC